MINSTYTIPILSFVYYIVELIIVSYKTTSPIEDTLDDFNTFLNNYKRDNHPGLVIVLCLSDSYEPKHPAHDKMEEFTTVFLLN